MKDKKIWATNAIKKEIMAKKFIANLGHIQGAGHIQFKRNIIHKENLSVMINQTTQFQNP